MFRVIVILLIASVACQTKNGEGKSGASGDKSGASGNKSPSGDKSGASGDKPAAQDCSSKCQRAPDETKCLEYCNSCSSADKSQCINDKAKDARKAEVKQGTDKAAQAKATCKDVKKPDERKACFQKEAAKLDQPQTGATKDQKKKIYDNLRAYQKKVNEYEKDVKKSKMKSYFGDMKKNVSKDELERKRRDMCAACFNGTNATDYDNMTMDEKKNMTMDEKKKMYEMKMCIDKCVKKTLVDVEASDLKDCLANATTDEEKSACFCAAKGDDDARKKISKSAETSRAKGVMEYMCDQYIDCKESKEIQCKEKMDSRLSMAKGKCKSGKEKLRLTPPQLKGECEKKQVKKAHDQCKEVVDKKNVAECVRDTTGFSKGKVQKMERQNLKKQFKDEMITCKSCSDGDSCPSLEECKNLTKAALFAELGSDCEGNFKALVEDGLEAAEQDANGTDQEVDVALKACEVIVQFAKGKGQCRPEGKMRSGLKSKFGQTGSSLDGVEGVADEINSTQIEKQVDGAMVQEATVTFKLRDLGNLTEAEIEAKCTMLAEKLLNESNGGNGGRRLSQLDTNDVADVAGAQASQTCLASDTSCQTSSLAMGDGDGDGSTSGDGDGDGSTTGAGDGDGDGSSTTTTTTAGDATTMDSAGVVRLSAIVVSISVVLKTFV